MTLGNFCNRADRLEFALMHNAHAVTDGLNFTEFVVPMEQVKIQLAVLRKEGGNMMNKPLTYTSQPEKCPLATRAIEGRERFR